MGYRRLLAKYMQHVNNRSGSIWLGAAVDDAITERDVSELRSIWQTIEREKEVDRQGDYNERMRTICFDNQLTSTDIAKHLGWPSNVIDQWLQPPDNPTHRRMSKRDFDHFYASVEHLLR